MKQTVYKKDSKGKIRQVIISALGDVVTQQSGLLDGNLTTHQSVSKGKNIGKSNETTPQEQAKLEAEAKITKKLKEGYFETIEEAETETVVLPMTAKTYEKEKHKIDWNNCFVQPKLDGMRCISFPGNKKVSRKNTPIETMDHIKVVNHKETIVDGELYSHGDSFQENMKLIKKYRPGKSEDIKLWIYDVVENVPFSERLKKLQLIADMSSNCVLVDTFKVKNELELITAHERFLSEGFEGTMVRWGKDGYAVNKRSSSLLKMKDFIDETYECIDIEPSDKAPKQGVAVCKSADGKIFRANFAFSHKEREEMLENKTKYIGQKAEIRFFEFTDDGIPRFPVCHGFRLDK